MNIYYGGPILTLDPAHPRVEALLTADNIIAALGNLEDLKALAPEAELVSLEGRTLMPGFVDGHSHLAMTGSYFNRCDLFGCTGYEDLLERIRAFRQKRDLTHGELILCSGYDHNSFKEGAHPTRVLLDSLGFDNPIICYHQSAHMLVCNTVVLEQCGLDDSYTPPATGSAGRDATGHLTGYFEEGAMAAVRPCLNQHTETEADVEKAILEAQDYYLRHGYTTLQDGSPNGAQRLALYERLADEGKLKADVVVYMNASDPALWDAVYARRGRDYRNHLKFGGVKIVLDGSPQARTAWMRQPYEGSSDYRGYPNMADDRVREILANAANHSVQVLAHCNGDAAAEQFLSIWEEIVAKAGHGEELRPVMIHAQLVGYDQLDRMKAVGMMPSFFVGHCYYWGDVHLKNFGPARGNRISPVKAAIERRLPYNFHQDTPVTPPNMIHSLWCAVNRLTRSGVCVGPENRVTVEEALIGATQGGAYSYFEEGHKGILMPGAQADLVIISDDPTAIPPASLKDLTVMETIKDGISVYKV